MEPENKPALSDILFKLATPDIYRNNAFCILDLPITASLKEINPDALMGIIATFMGFYQGADKAVSAFN